jgi:hypothetical protein
MSTFTCKSPAAHRPVEVSAPSAEDPAPAAPLASGPAAGARRAAAGARRTAAREIGGVAGPEPTRFGDWEKNGRCIDF